MFSFTLIILATSQLTYVSKCAFELTKQLVLCGVKKNLLHMKERLAPPETFSKTNYPSTISSRFLEANAHACFNLQYKERKMVS